MPELSVIELFSGVGAQVAALRYGKVPHKIKGVSEIDADAIQAYTEMHGVTKNYGDITKIEKLEYADCWTYSFPCQSVSLNGKREGFKKGSGSKSSLLWEVERLLRNSEKPKFLILENVKNLVGVKFKEGFLEWLSVLKGIGYNTYWRVIKATEVGVGQARERVIAVSVRKDIEEGFTFKYVGTEGVKRIEDYLEKGFSDAAEDVPKDFVRKEAKEGCICKYLIPKRVRVRVQEVEQEEWVEKWREISKAKGISKRQIAADLSIPITQVEHWYRKDRYGSMPDGETWGKIKSTYSIDVEEHKMLGMDKHLLEYVEHDCAYNQTNRVYDIKGVCPTITTLSQEIRITDGKKIRELTLREVWRLMGFKDEDTSKITLSAAKQYKLVGNSIVVDVLISVFKEIKELNS